MDSERPHHNIGKILWSRLRRLDTSAGISLSVDA